LADQKWMASKRGWHSNNHLVNQHLRRSFLELKWNAKLGGNRKYLYGNFR